VGAAKSISAMRKPGVPEPAWLTWARHVEPLSPHDGPGAQGPVSGGVAGHVLPDEVVVLLDDEAVVLLDDDVVVLLDDDAAVVLLDVAPPDEVPTPVAVVPPVPAAAPVPRSTVTLAPQATSEPRSMVEAKEAAR